MKVIHSLDWQSVIEQLSGKPLFAYQPGVSPTWGTPVYPGNPVESDLCLKIARYARSIDYGRSVVIDDQTGEDPWAQSARKRVSAKDFHRRCRAGEIIINPYQVYNIYVEPHLLRLDRKEGTSSSVLWCNDPKQFWNPRFSPRCTHDPFNFVEHGTGRKRYGFTDFFGKYECPNFGAGSPSVPVGFLTEYYDEQLMSDIYGSTPEEFGRSLINKASQLPIDGALIQRTTADANAGDVDALTALAELPETVHSIVDGLTLIRKMLRDFKSKELFISKSHQQKALKQQRLDRSRGHFMSKKRFIAAGGNPKEYRRARQAFINNINKKSDDLNKFYSKAFALDAAEATASVWLNYRYNILPNVYLVQDSLKAISSFYSPYKSYRNIQKNEFLEPERGYVFEGENVLIQRSFCKRLYRIETDLKRLNAVIGADILVTAFEKIPLWSIIIDWFASITSFLRSINFDPKHVRQGFSYSNRVKVDGYLINPSDRELRIKVKMDFYQRFKIENPYYYTQIYFTFDLNLQRKLDALSFAFLSHKGSLKSYSGN